MSEIFGQKVIQHFPTLITVTYRFTCRVCSKSKRQTWYGNRLAMPIHPGRGWKEEQLGVWLCPTHSGSDSK